MAEVVGLVAAAGQFVEQSIKIIKLSKALYDKVQGAPEELKAWGQEIEEVQKLVISIKDSLALRGSDNTHTTIDRCKSVSNDLQTLFKELDFKETDPLGRKTWKAIGGLAKESDIRRLFEEIERLKSTLNTQIEVANLNQGYETNKQLKNLKSLHQSGTMEDNCLKDLFVTDAVGDREGIITAKGHRTPGTCEWITTTEEFQKWETSQSDLLWISGPPGKGKTMISVYLTQLFEISKPGTTIIYFFCDNKVASRNSAVNLLRGLIYQLIQQHEKLISFVLSPWKIQGESLFNENSFENLWRIFQQMLESLTGHDVCCVLDALDECEESSLPGLLFKLQALFRPSSSKQKVQNLQLVVLSREHPQCLPNSLSEFPHIQVNEVQHDIRLYISERVNRLAAMKGRENSDLHRHIEKTFLERSEGTFLWVSFMSQDLEAKTIDQIEASLAQLPQGIEAVYERILSQIQPGNWEPVFDMLIWLTLATRPLTIGEICEATQIKPTPTLTSEQVCKGYIRSCGHLLQLSTAETRFIAPWYIDNKGQTEESDSPRNLIVNFVHQSAKEFLLQQHESLERRKYSINSEEGHVNITNRLLQYLGSGCLDNPHEDGRQTYPLRDYSTYHWHYHLRHLGGDDCARVVDGNKDFFGKASELRGKWGCIHFRGLFPTPNDKDSLPVLQMASDLGLYYVAEHLLLKRSTFFGLGRRKKVNLRWGEHCQTPLQKAAERQDEQLIGLLLKCGADPSIEDYRGYTALHSALANNDSGAFSTLLATKKARKVIRKDSSCFTGHGSLLHIAAQHGNEVVLCDLIEKHHYNTEVLTESSETPLCMALRGGHLGLARILVCRYGAKTDSHFRLMNAAKRCYGAANVLEEILQLLVKEWSVDINATDTNGNTILWSHEDTSIFPDDLFIGPEQLKQFLKFGCDPGWRNLAGQTVLYQEPLSYGCLGIILRDGRVDINDRDTLGQTAIHFFLRTATIGVMKHLWAPPKSRLTYLELLLDFGADRSIADAAGMLPSKLALELLHTPFLDFAGSNPDEDSLDRICFREACRFLKSGINLLENYSTVPRDPTVVPLGLEIEQ